jgi:hypothetical protein
MKVLWDCWDEIQEFALPIDPPEPGEPVTPVPDPHLALEEQADKVVNHIWMYWLGFGAIVSGIAMQFSRSEYLGLSGLIVMFLGSLLLAWKSIMGMRQVSSAGPHA